MSMVKGLLLAGMVALLPSCSGSSSDPEEEVTVEPKNDDELADAPKPAAAPEPAPTQAEEAAAAPVEAPPPAPLAPPPAPTPPPEPEGFSGPKVTRHVRTVAIKVHTLPNKEAPVLGWVKKGDALNVVVNGDWAKLGPGRYISNKFLVDHPVAPSPGPVPAKAK